MRAPSAVRSSAASEGHDAPPEPSGAWRFENPSWNRYLGLFLVCVGYAIAATGLLGVLTHWNEIDWRIELTLAVGPTTRGPLPTERFWPYLTSFGMLMLISGWFLDRRVLRWAAFFGAMSIAAFVSAVLSVER